MGYKIGVSTGLYTVARSEELANILKKLGYGITRGTSVIELTADIPHEINISDGKELRSIAKKQGVELTLHGSLTVPIAIPERGEWRDADDHMKKSVRSAVFAGCTYVNFHSCLNIWLELMTYAGRKLTMVFCDHEGNFISKILKENKKLRKWFVEARSDDYLREILKSDERAKIDTQFRLRRENWKKDQIENRLRPLLNKILPEEVKRRLGVDNLVLQAMTTDRPPHIRIVEIDRQISELFDKLNEEEREQTAKIQKEIFDEFIENKLSKGEEWETEEQRGAVGVIDGYRIMANYMFFTKDPLWLEMARLYSKDLKKYKFDENDLHAVDKAWKKAEQENDKKFKEFFYAAVASKFVEGHLKKLFEWINTDFKKEIDNLKLSKEEEAAHLREKLHESRKNIQICLESPDARDPQHAGMFLLWSPKQVYATVKKIRENLKNDRIWLLMDYEHVASQGIDAIEDMKEIVEKKIAPDYGEYVLSVHSDPPNPLHAMEALELGDVRIYWLLYLLRVTGFGKKRDGYLIFERGGAKDPFGKSVEVLRLCKKFLEQDVHPDDLPMEYFGMKGEVAGDIIRQKQIIQDHAYEPMKDLLEMPEEEWTMISQAAVKKGKRPEVFKKGEFR